MGCFMKECSERKVNNSAEYSCGNDNCYENVNSGIGDLCSSICGMNSKGILGVCRSCEDIIASDSTSCSGGSLSNCYYKIGVDRCVTNCGEFYSANVNYCILKDCSDRTTTGDIGDSESCGPNCVWDPESNNTGKCATTCSDRSHKINENNKCVFDGCDNIEPSSSETNPCGSKCLKDIVDDKEVCLQMCSNNAHYKNISGICELRNCSDREYNKSADYQCGNDSECIFILKFDEKSGKCFLKSCNNSINSSGCLNEIDKDCLTYSAAECVNIGYCNLIDGMCMHVENGTVNSTITAEVIGGFFFSFFFYVI
jgi:hypothetical protein